jgi:hypothetical protein
MIERFFEALSARWPEPHLFFCKGVVSLLARFELRSVLAFAALRSKIAHAPDPQTVLYVHESLSPFSLPLRGYKRKPKRASSIAQEARAAGSTAVKGISQALSILRTNFVPESSPAESR